MISPCLDFSVHHLNYCVSILSQWDSVLVDWLSVSIYVFIPFLTGGISLSSGSGEWWEHTCIAWIVGVFAYYLLFAGVTIWFEIDGCLEMIHARTGYDKHSIRAVKEAILMKQRSMLSGFERYNFLLEGSEKYDAADYEASKEKHYEEKGAIAAPATGPLSQLTKLLSKCGLFYEKIEPQRIYTVDEVRGYTPFVTSQTWGLEKMYCRNRKASMIAVIEGEVRDGNVVFNFILSLISTLYRSHMSFLLSLFH